MPLVINQETHIFGIKMCDKPMSVTLMTVFWRLAGSSARLSSRALRLIGTGVAPRP